MSSKLLLTCGNDSKINLSRKLRLGEVHLAHGGQVHPAVADLLARHGASGMFGRETPSARPAASAGAASRWSAATGKSGWRERPQLARCQP